jgi:hypothetical protein
VNKQGSYTTLTIIPFDHHQNHSLDAVYATIMVMIRSSRLFIRQNSRRRLNDPNQVIGGATTTTTTSTAATAATAATTATGAGVVTGDNGDQSSQSLSSNNNSSSNNKSSSNESTSASASRNDKSRNNSSSSSSSSSNSSSGSSNSHSRGMRPEMSTRRSSPPNNNSLRNSFNFLRSNSLRRLEQQQHQQQQQPTKETAASLADVQEIMEPEEDENDLSGSQEGDKGVVGGATRNNSIDSNDSFADLSNGSMNLWNGSFASTNECGNGSFSSYQPSHLELLDDSDDDDDDDDDESDTSYGSDELNDILLEDDDDDEVNSLCESDDDDDDCWNDECDSHGSETCTTVTGSLYSSGYPGSDEDNQEVHEEEDCHHEDDDLFATATATTTTTTTVMRGMPHWSSSSSTSLSSSSRLSLDRRTSLKRSNSSKRNVVVASAMKSAKFLRGIVRANSAKTLMHVLESTENAPLDMSSSSSCCKASSSSSNNNNNNNKNAGDMRKPQRTSSTTAGGMMRKPERALSGMVVPPPQETPSRPSKPSFYPSGVAASASVAPSLPAGFVDEEPEILHKKKSLVGIDKKKNRRVVFATNTDGSVQCSVQHIQRIEEKEDCWYSVQERNDSSDNFASVVEYYQDNAEYVESLKRLYNIARLTSQEMQRHLQTLSSKTILFARALCCDANIPVASWPHKMWHNGRHRMTICT